jgi:ribose 1,5-bisphosphokinase
VLIEVSPSVLRQRLQKRGRESAAEIEARLWRHQQIQPPIEHCIVINNDGALSEASRAFIEAVRQPVRDTALCR